VYVPVGAVIVNTVPAVPGAAVTSSTTQASASAVVTREITEQRSHGSVCAATAQRPLRAARRGLSPYGAAMPDDLALALALADAADAITLPAFDRGEAVTAKADGTPVTEADRAVERALRERLAAERPGDAVLGEELGEVAGGDRRWVLDPLDGTEWFARGIPVWGILIALEQAGEPIVAVVSAPALRRRWWAARGGGAFRDGRPIAVSRVTAVEDAFVAHANLFLGFPVDAAPLLGAARLSGGFESFLPLMLVAEGAADAAFAPRGFLWDLLPAQLIVEEAGGMFTDFDGRRTAAGRGAVAANPVLHADVLARLQASAASSA
jgi:histidinol-phosphatase